MSRKDIFPFIFWLFFQVLRRWFPKCGFWPVAASRKLLEIHTPGCLHPTLGEWGPAICFNKASRGCLMLQVWESLFWETGPLGQRWASFLMDSNWRGWFLKHLGPDPFFYGNSLGERTIFQKICSPFYPCGVSSLATLGFCAVHGMLLRSSPPQGLHTDGPETRSRLSLLVNSSTSHRPQPKYHLCGEEVNLNSAPMKCSHSTPYFFFPAHNHDL